MAKILILFAHPALEKSRVHNRLIRRVHDLEGITFHDLYEAYPEFDIDVGKEQQLLLAHDIIIFQHPFYWYSAPAMIKQWLDLVLEHGWAYGSGGTQLTGKQVLNAITCGASREVYRREGRNRFTIRELLVPFEQTAFLCRMNYLPPFVVHGTHRLTIGDMELQAVQYRQLLETLRDEKVRAADLLDKEYLNDLLLSNQALPNH